MQLYLFIKAYVDAAPAFEGLYCLYDSGELIYVGRAIGLGVTIRSRLQDHLAGRAGWCTQYATHFGWQFTSNAAQEEVNVLEAFQRRFGRLPRCNQRIG